MPYTSLAALQRRLGPTTLVQLTDRGEQATGEVDPAVVGQALADTDAQIDASLAVRYRLPLGVVPPFVADLALAIAAYKLHPFEPDKKVQADYEQALKDLRDLATGTKKLDVVGAEPPTAETGGVVWSDRERMFTVDSLAGFI